jgi:hypothetical protein
VGQYILQAVINIYEGLTARGGGGSNLNPIGSLKDIIQKSARVM